MNRRQRRLRARRSERRGIIHGSVKRFLASLRHGGRSVEPEPWRRSVVDAAGETQTVAIEPSPIGGTFTILAGAGASDPVPYDAPMEDVQAAFDQAVARNRPGPNGPRPGIVHMDEVELIDDEDFEKADPTELANRIAFRMQTSGGGRTAIVEHPTEQEWTDLTALAKQRKRGVHRLAEKDFELLSEAADPKVRTSWVRKS